MEHKTTFEKLPHRQRGRSKNWKTLRIACLLLFLNVSFTVHSQITVNVKDLSLRASLKKIEQVSSYKFFYSESLSELSQKVSLNVKDATIGQTMQRLLNGMGLTYKEEKDNVIVLIRKEQESATDKKKKVTGTVVDEKGDPVIGASVVVKGESHGTVTDLDGKFSLDVFPTNKQLQVSYIGYANQVISLNNRSDIQVILKENTELLDEVVVVGYGVQKKANLTGAVATVSQETLKDRPVANVGRALQGVIPNLNVTLSSGQPGAGASLNVRGTTSPNGGSPLVLVDGVESSLERINSNDIESITVLKDASSAAIYGARAAFGVILVTTKGGHYNEKTEVSYNGSFSVSSPTTSTNFETRGYYSAKIADLFSLSSTGNPYTSYTTDEYQALWERRNDETEQAERPWVVTKQRNGKQEYVYLANFDWYNYLYDDSRPTWDHNINIKGGGKSLSYMISGRYYSQKGINRLEPDRFNSYNFRVKLQANITPWLTLSNNTNFFSSVYKYYGFESEADNFRKPTLHALASFVPVNPDGTAVSHTTMTKSASHYMMDGYNAMMQKGKSGGHKRSKEITDHLQKRVD